MAGTTKVDLQPEIGSVELAQREFPNSSPEVNAYLMAIKKKINDEKVA